MAIADYERGIQISPDNPFPFYNLGISLDKKGEYDAAIKYFDKAIQLDSSKADFFHNRGFAWRKKKKLD